VRRIGTPLHDVVAGPLADIGKPGVQVETARRIVAQHPEPQGQSLRFRLGPGALEKHPAQAMSPASGMYMEFRQEEVVGPALDLVKADDVWTGLDDPGLFGTEGLGEAVRIPGIIGLCQGAKTVFLEKRQSRQIGGKGAPEPQGSSAPAIPPTRPGDHDGGCGFSGSGRHGVPGKKGFAGDGITSRESRSTP